MCEQSRLDSVYRSTSTNSSRADCTACARMVEGWITSAAMEKRIDECRREWAMKLSMSENCEPHSTHS
ncbi:unnamed protein product [Nippostrongylus brasiliensis]|uniref:Uncharacterized protein n=1 Tax=Nippostrongylus brasiliensis TaxID=27835 RepID=A0A0N4XGK8_NIPBR|nr:unnamed protein product [Nippostrongylus brasiliensis]